MSPSRQSRSAQTTRKTTTPTLVHLPIPPSPASFHLISNPPTDSEISSDDEAPPTLDESLSERLLALRDIIPPTTRTTISSFFSTTSGYVTSTLGFGGKALFVLSTSALLLGVPWALAFAEEQQIADMENEMRAREVGSEVSFPSPPSPPESV